MSEMQDDNPIHTFLTAVGQVSAPFVHSFQVQMALRDPDLPYTEKDFRDVIRTYCIWRRNTSPWILSNQLEEHSQLLVTPHYRERPLLRTSNHQVPAYVESLNSIANVPIYSTGKEHLTGNQIP
jgi:hypothetical protein